MNPALARRKDQTQDTRLTVLDTMYEFSHPLLAFAALLLPRRPLFASTQTFELLPANNMSYKKLATRRGQTHLPFSPSIQYLTSSESMELNTSSSSPSRRHLFDLPREILELIRGNSHPESVVALNHAFGKRFFPHPPPVVNLSRWIQTIQKSLRSSRDPHASRTTEADSLLSTDIRTASPENTATGSDRSRKSIPLEMKIQAANDAIFVVPPSLGSQKDWGDIDEAVQARLKETCAGLSTVTFLITGHVSSSTTCRTYLASTILGGVKKMTFLTDRDQAFTSMFVEGMLLNNSNVNEVEFRHTNLSALPFGNIKSKATSGAFDSARRAGQHFCTRKRYRPGSNTTLSRRTYYTGVGSDYFPTRASWESQVVMRRSIQDAMFESRNKENYSSSREIRKMVWETPSNTLANRSALLACWYKQREPEISETAVDVFVTVWEAEQIEASWRHDPSSATNLSMVEARHSNTAPE